jgi:uncharacterized protein YbaR (Trm112 family)
MRPTFDRQESWPQAMRIWPQGHEKLPPQAAGKHMDSRLLEILACPICKGTLKFQRDAQVLVCRMDRLAYPIRDDVPVMLEEEARQLSADDPLLDR